MDRLLDVTGLSCPLPILKARKALDEMPVGAVLTLLATDPASTIDVRHFCNTTGHELVEADQREGIFTYRIRRAATGRGG